MMMSSLRTLLTGLIDYAGLFPPASLGMREAVAGYAAYLASEDAWALGRFIVPATRLNEFAEFADARQRTDPRHTPSREWKLSMLATAADAAAIEGFNARHAGTMIIDAAEMKAASAAEIRDTAKALQALDLYFEVPLTECSSLLRVIAECHARAKIRTGGVTPALIPTTHEVAAFLEACHAHRLAFKATAGLHHPLRSMRPLTYEPGCAQATMHGFLNVFLAAALVYSGGSAADALRLLNETDQAAFHFHDDAVHWRTDVQFSTSLLADTRAQFAASFGSCSFTEPMDEVKALYKLEAEEQRAR